MTHPLVSRPVGDQHSRAAETIDDFRQVVEACSEPINDCW